MKNIFTICGLLVLSACAGEAQVPSSEAKAMDGVATFEASTSQDVKIPQGAKVVYIHAIKSYFTGCSPRTLDLQYELSSGNLNITEKADRFQEGLQFVLDKVTEVLGDEAAAKVRLALFPTDGPGQFTCQAEMPIFGEVFVKLPANTSRTLQVSLPEGWREISKVEVYK